jgi:4-hydroxybenzoate polyprenyltransferase
MSPATFFPIFTPMIAFFKLIRLPNLLIMAFTQYMVRWCLLIPIMKLNAYDLDYSLLGVQMSEFDFFLLVLSTVMIGAAGYIINDYFDVRIDGVNRPDTNLVGKQIKRRVAMGAHMTINFIGAGLGIYLSWKYNYFRVGATLFIAVPALLWIYSTNLKRRFLVGNLVIALLSAIVPLIVVLFEIPNIKAAFPEFVSGGYLNLSYVFRITLLIALFAFVITLLREIIKDVEDYEGDMEYGCKTMPIVIGIARTKFVLAAISAMVIAGLGWLQYLQMGAKDWSSFTYFTLLLQLPLLYLGYRVLNAKGKKDWRFCSILVKIIMVAGISFLFLFAHQINGQITV